MTKEFKVGDKVCHIGFGNGIVTSRDDKYNNAIGVDFSGKSEYFTIYGKVDKSDQSPSLYHGHGTFQFIPEPEHSWQWLYFCNDVKRFWASIPYKSEAEFIEALRYTPKWYERIEESKKEV